MIIVVTISSLPVDRRIVDILMKQGIQELYPYQEDAIKKVIAGKNVVLSAPTASGKSLVAYIGLLSNILNNGGKAMYIVPLRALAVEKYEELNKFEKLGIRVTLSHGDMDDAEPELDKFDVIITTSEKADSLLRHRSYWLNKLTFVVVDEIHLVNDGIRGPTLEIILTRFKQFNLQLVCLSATISNSHDLAKWLNAEHVYTDWRPVPLHEGYLYKGKIIFADGTTRKIKKVDDEITSLVIDAIENNGYTLIFTTTRNYAEKLSERLANVISDYTKDRKEKFRYIVKEIKKAESEKTVIGKKLEDCIRYGVAFHHAGLSNSLRRVVEKNFRAGNIYCVVATPTLAAGINMPARRVIIHHLNRYDSNFGMVPIPVMEIKQMEGRAGRPQYDTFGEAIFIAKSERDKNRILERYIDTEPEPVYSKLGVENALRTHILSSIATGFVNDRAKLKDFIKKTFYAYQTDIDRLNYTIENIISYLEENDLTRNFKPTRFGKRVSDLYIDPVTAVIIRDIIKKDKISEIGIIHAICSAPDIRSLYLRKDDYAWIEVFAEKHANEFLYYPNDYEYFLSSTKTALLLYDWINEIHHETIEMKYHVGPGDIHSLVETAVWLLYSAVEISRIFNRKHIIEFDTLRKRMQYGIKSELMELISLKGIGRRRARILYNHNFRTLDDLKKADIQDIQKISGIGKSVAKEIKKQLENM